MSSALSVTGLTKDYAVRVLQGVDLELLQGEAHALIGANGAGKSTFCQMIAGNTPVSAGTMTLAGAPYSPKDKRDAEQRGVQIVQQELSLLPTLSVAENLFFGNLPRRLGWIDYRALHRQAKVALAAVGLEALDPATTTGTLGVGTQQLIEIAGALAADCSVLILDEPTAALTAAEIETLFNRVRELTARNVCVVYVSHRLDEIKTLCDRFSVLCDGRLQGTQSTASTDTEQMVAMMAGELDPVTGSSDAVPTFRSYATAEPALQIDGLCAGPLVQDISLRVHKGERVGIAGLVGSGRSELLRAIFGAEQATAGTVTVGDGAPQPPFRHPQHAVAAGLALVTEDRKLDGLMLAQSVQTNASINSLPERWGWIDARQEAQRTAARTAQLAVKYHDINAPVDQLSGGNQQKVVLAKWLETGAAVLLLDEPTRGIDVGARRQIEALFETLVSEGHGLLMVSSDIDELLDSCDTLYALSEGRLIARFERGQWTREAVMEAALGDHRSSTPLSPQERSV